MRFLAESNGIKVSMDGIWEPNPEILKARKSAKNCGDQLSNVMWEHSSMLPLPAGLKPYKLVCTKFHPETPLSFTATTEAQLSQSPAADRVEPHICDPQSRPSLTLGRLCWALVMQMKAPSGAPPRASNSRLRTGTDKGNPTV